jgi:WD40 repeat protein
LPISVQHKDEVVAFAFSPTNEKYIATGITDGTVKVWATNGNLVKTLPNQDDQNKSKLVDIAFHPKDDRHLAIARADGTIEIRKEDNSAKN